MHFESVIVVPLPSPLVTVTRVKSTLLLASVNAVKRGGYFERYRAALDAAAREPLLESLAGGWLPLSVAAAHYRACDALELTPEQQLELGKLTGSGVRTTLTLVAGALTRSLGVSPWTLFDYFPRFWVRGFEGGGIQIRKDGPKDATITYAACPLLASQYFRSALRGVAIGIIGNITHSCRMAERPGRHDEDTAEYRVAWT